jgi:hypothetical protein
LRGRTFIINGLHSRGIDIIFVLLRFDTKAIGNLQMTFLDKLANIFIYDLVFSIYNFGVDQNFAIVLVCEKIE